MTSFNLNARKMTATKQNEGQLHTWPMTYGNFESSLRANSIPLNMFTHKWKSCHELL